MKTNEVAKIFGLSAMTIRNWADNGKLQCERVGDHREFDIETVKEFFLSKLREQLFHIMVCRQRLKYIQELPNDDRKLLLSDTLLISYLRLTELEVIRCIITLIGPKSSCLRNLLTLCFNTKNKKRGEKLLQKINNCIKNSGLRKFRDALEHDLMTEKTIMRSEITKVLNLIYEFFQIVSPNYIIDEKHGVFGAERVIEMHLHMLKNYVKFCDMKLKIALLTSQPCTMEIWTDAGSGITHVTHEGKEVVDWKM